MRGGGEQAAQGENTQERQWAVVLLGGARREHQALQQG